MELWIYRRLFRLKIAALVEGDEQASLLRSGNPRTTLERLFLKETGGESRDGSSGDET